MRIFMVSDIEGLTGVYHWAQTKPGNPAYDEARELLMGDLLAAVEGAHDGGADEIVVYDMHESGRNILYRPPARLCAPYRRQASCFDRGVSHG